MNYFVISPNADGQGSDFLPEIRERHVAPMGWDTDNDKGVMFANIQKGDRIIIAQGANRNKRIFAIGIADSKAHKGFFSTQEIHLYPFIQDKQRLNDILFNEDCTYGSANRIPAIYRLHDNNLADKNIIKTIENILKDNQMINALTANHNIILHGAPGTGKTYIAKKMAKDMDATIGFVQFHPSYDYTDFVEGLRPTSPNIGGQIGFQRKDGVFKDFCKRALEAYNETTDKANAPKFVFIIDEINRGDISKIFGELFFSIDPCYRGEEGRVKTQYQNMIEDVDVFHDGFYVPENVYIVGTMNDIDRSVESMDFAMRRRFAFYEITAEDSKDMLNKDTFKKKCIENISDATIDAIKQKMDALNNAIVSKEIGLSKDYQIGAAYFLKYALYATEEDAFMKLWNNHLLSVLTEYLRGTGDEEEKIEILKQAYNSSETNND